MTRRNYFVVSSAVFAVVALVHLVRVMQEWGVVLDGYEIPLWASWVALFVAGYLAFMGYGFRKGS